MKSENCRWKFNPGCFDFYRRRNTSDGGEVKTRRADMPRRGATNRNLETAVREEVFREDLFYRLNVISIQMPALRERSRDVQALAENYLGFSQQCGKRLKGFSPESSRP